MLEHCPHRTTPLRTWDRSSAQQWRALLNTARVLCFKHCTNILPEVVCYFSTSKMSLQIFNLLVWSCRQKYHPPEIGFCVIFSNQRLVPGFDQKRCCQGIPSRDSIAQPEFTEEILDCLKQWMRALASSALSTAPELSAFGRSISWKQWLGHKAVLGSNPGQWQHWQQCLCHRIRAVPSSA